MKRFVIKYFCAFALLVVGGLILGVHPVAAHYVPDIDGYVLAQGTNAPIAGVWVKLTSKVCNGNQSSRYAKTDSRGHYVFLGWTQMGNNTDAHVGENIDTDLDGKPDADWYPTYDWCLQTSDHVGSIFSCGRDPFTITVVKPVSWNGTFDVIGPDKSPCIYCISNSQPAPEVPTLYYHPKNASPPPTATVKASPTPKPSISSSPSPTPKIDWCNPDCTNKQIGDFQSGVITTFQPLTSVKMGLSYFVRITVNNLQAGLTPYPTVPLGGYTLDENINTKNFKIDKPLLNQTFYIKKPGSGGQEISITNDVCPDSNNDKVPDCVSGYTSGHLKITPDETLDTTDTRYIYFQVTPAAAGSSVPIDAPSELTYDEQSVSLGVDAGSVTIDNPEPYFQIFKGDLYSAGSVVSHLPDSVNYFASQKEPVLFFGDTKDFRNGKMSETNRNAMSYSISSHSLSYDALYKDHQKEIVTKKIDSLAALDHSGVYESDSNTLVISGSSWDTPIKGKSLMIFVPGNLYIDQDVSLSVAEDGKSSLVFVVKGNMGIDPDVNSIQGMYFVEGVIDTACQSRGSAPWVSCTPELAHNSNLTPLTLSGSFIAQKGFNLDRIGIQASSPGERFIFRPDLLLSSIQSLGQTQYVWHENVQ